MRLAAPGSVRTADDGADIDEWAKRMLRGRLTVAQVRDLAGPVARYLREAHVRTQVAMPVRAEGKTWGYLVLDNCTRQRSWRAADLEAVRRLAALIGGAATGEMRIGRLADANRIVENSPTVLYRLEPKDPFRLTFLSRNFRQYGYEADELLANQDLWQNIVTPADIGQAIEILNSFVAGNDGPERLDLRYKRPDGTVGWFTGESRAVRDDAGTLLAIEGIMTDITDRKLANEQLAALARTDLLTGLANRAGFIERLNLAFARGGRSSGSFAVLYLDLDHFKDVNDTLGHPVGDELLRAVAQRLKHAVRSIDLVARFGGDEFAILLEDVADTASIEHLAGKLAHAIAEPFTAAGNRINTTASIGIVAFEPDIADPDAMLQRADLALYRAKQEGRNQFRFHVAELDVRALDRMSLGADLHGAIERGEFMLLYQPQIEVPSGRLVGIEAVPEWVHPVRGPLPPTEFMPVAESNGTILQIGEWTLREIRRQIMQWRAAGLAVPVVAMNVFAAQFQFAAAVDNIVETLLGETGVRPEDLEFELTESALMETTLRHREAFDRLYRLGVRLTIDDFGAGFSSLNYLSSFKVSRLKLAGTFIERATTSPGDAAIVRATIGLARELGIDFIASGVRSREQLELLISAGCRYVQGALGGDPVPAEAMARLLSPQARGASGPRSSGGQRSAAGEKAPRRLRAM